MESRLDFLILSILNEQKAYGQLSGITLKEMNPEAIGYKNNTAYKRINKLIKSGIIAKGVLEGKQNTYFLTDAGKQLIKKE